MSIGFYDHPHLGLVRRYILNNKNIIQAEYNAKHIRSWTSRYQKFHSIYLKNKKIKFVLYPQQSFLQEKEQDLQEDSCYGARHSKQQKLTIVYDHFVLTLGDEIRQRVTNRQVFNKIELWYFLYCLVQAALQLIDVHAVFSPEQTFTMHPQTILLDQLGMIKLLGFYSSPIPVVRNSLFQTPTVEQTPGFKRCILQGTYAVGRIMASLMLCQELCTFQRGGRFDMLAFSQVFRQIKGNFGILGNIVDGMLQGIPDQRILLHEISAFLQPYSECILQLQGFRLDRKMCEESITKILTKAD